MKSNVKMTDAELDALLAKTFDSLKPPEALLDSVRDAVARNESASVADSKAKGTSACAPRFQKVRRTTNRARAIAALAACVALGAFGFGGYAAWADVVAVVGVDVNPSIELSLNRFDRVVAARGVNDDGALVLEETPVVGKDYGEALALLVADHGANGGSADGEEVSITVVPMGSTDASVYVDGSARAVEGAGCRCVCNYATEDEYDRAQAAGLPVGKFRMVLQLQAAGVDIDEGRAAEMSMRELRALMPSGSEPSDSEPSDETVGENGKHGNGDGAGRHGQQGSGNGKAHANANGNGSGNGKGCASSSD